METAEAVLQRCYLFQDLTAAECRDLFQTVAHTRKVYTKGQRLLSRGEVYESLHFILSGEVLTQMEMGPDKVMGVETIRTGEAIATAILFATDNTLPVNVVATSSEVEVLIFPLASVITLCRKYEKFLFAYLKDCGNKVVFLAEKMKVIKFATLKQKLAAYLLDVMSKQGSTVIRLPYSKETLSEVFGVARPSLSRTFSEMEDQGLFSSEGRTVTLHKVEMLREVLKIEV